MTEVLIHLMPGTAKRWFSVRRFRQEARDFDKVLGDLQTTISRLRSQLPDARRSVSRNQRRGQSYPGQTEGRAEEFPLEDAQTAAKFIVTSFVKSYRSYFPTNTSSVDARAFYIGDEGIISHQKGIAEKD